MTETVLENETVLEVAEAVITHQISVGYAPSDDKARQRFQELRAAVLNQNVPRCQKLLVPALEVTEKNLQDDWPRKRDPRLQALMDRVYAALNASGPDAQELG